MRYETFSVVRIWQLPEEFRGPVTRFFVGEALLRPSYYLWEVEEFPNIVACGYEGLERFNAALEAAGITEILILRS